MTNGELRAQARTIANNLLGSLPAGSEVHHRIPLQYRHVQPGLHPNRLDNLVVMTDSDLYGKAETYHLRIHDLWRKNMNQLPDPTQAEIEAIANEIDRHMLEHFPEGAVRYLEDYI